MYTTNDHIRCFKTLQVKYNIVTPKMVLFTRANQIQIDVGG